MLLSYALLCMLPLFVVLAMAAMLTRSKRISFMLSSAILAEAIALSTYLLYTGADTIVLGAFHVYGFSLLFVALFSFALLLVNALTYLYSKDYAENLLMLSFVFVGALAVPAANTLLVLFIGLELIAVPTAFMMLLAGRHYAEATVKFFILSAAAIAVFSFALALVFPYSNMSISSLAANPNIGGNALMLLALILFVFALGFGAELFPLDLWVPDVYEGSPSYVTALLSGVNKNIAMVALLEIVLVVFAAYRTSFSSIALLLSVLTMFFGNLVALSQTSVKRLFAYASISQAGYLLIGLASASQFGLTASIFQMISHSLMITGAFAIVLWLEFKGLRTIDDYGGLNSRNRFAAASLTLLMLSMAGVPPLMGFVGKFLLFSSAIDSGALFLAFIGILNSFISIVYYARVISAMYSTTEHAILRMDPLVSAVVIASLALVFVLGIYPQPAIAVAQLASKALLGV